MVPYSSNEQLPGPVRRHLPLHAQDIYRKAFNNAWRHYPLDARRDEISRRIAWSAVKHSYHRGPEGFWLPIDPYAHPPNAANLSVY